MDWKVCAAALALSAAVLGCEKKDDTTPATPVAGQSTADKAYQHAEDVLGKAKEEGAKAVDAVKEEGAKAVEAVKEEGAKAIDAVKESEAGQAVANAAAGAGAQADELIAKAVEYAKENKWELADTTLAQVEKIKDTLPEAAQSKIVEARKLIDTHKATAVPAVPAAPAIP